MKSLYFILFLLSLTSCSKKISSNSSSTNENQIEAVLKMQEDAWNRGDISGFMEGYWKNKNLKFVGSKGINFGWETTLENYQKSYPNTSIMGKLHFDIDLIEKLSDDTYYLIGRYSLTRENDTPRGYFNLIWRKIDGKWKIVTDMTCG
jgi:ketosteroid isomerase-like protein